MSAITVGTLYTLRVGMIHPDATVDECMQMIGDLEREIERLRAFAQYVVDMDPDNPAPLFKKARRALEGKP